VEPWVDRGFSCIHLPIALIRPCPGLIGVFPDNIAWICLCYPTTLRRVPDWREAWRQAFREASR
jgi:hypothetical protein